MTKSASAEPKRSRQSDIKFELVDGAFERIADEYECDEVECELEGPIGSGQVAFIVTNKKLGREPGFTSCLACALRLKGDDGKAIKGARERAKLWAIREARAKVAADWHKQKGSEDVRRKERSTEQRAGDDGPAGGHPAEGEPADSADGTSDTAGESPGAGEPQESGRVADSSGSPSGPG